MSLALGLAVVPGRIKVLVQVEAHLNVKTIQTNYVSIMIVRDGGDDVKEIETETHMKRQC